MNAEPCKLSVTISETRVENDGLLCAVCGFWLKETTASAAVRRSFVHSGQPIPVARSL